MITAEKKRARIERAKRHAEADMLIAGCYVSGGKGCSVGCDAIDILGIEGAKGGGLHKIVADNDGTPEWLEHLRDVVFEGLPDDRRAWWHVALAEAIPVGVDLVRAHHKIHVAILDVALRGIAGNTEPYAAECRAAIDTVRHLHGVAATEGSWDRVAAEAEMDAAEAAWGAAEAAWGAAESWAWGAVSAAWGAVSAARSAAWGAESAVRSAESAAWSEIADAVINILSSEESAS